MRCVRRTADNDAHADVVTFCSCRCCVVVQLMSQTDFTEQLQRAIAEPNTPAARALERTVDSLVTVVCSNQ